MYTDLILTLAIQTVFIKETFHIESLTGKYFISMSYENNYSHSNLTQVYIDLTE